MNLFAYPPLISAFLFFILGLFVYLKHKKSSINITFALLCLTTFGWQFTWYILFSFGNPKNVLLLTKIGYSWIIFIPITYFHFAVNFLGAKQEKKYLIFSYSLGIFFLVNTWFNKSFINGYYFYFWGYYPKAGYLHPLYLSLLVFLAVRGLYILIIYKKRERYSPLTRTQIKYITWSVIPYLFASSDFIVNYGIGFYPTGFIFILISLGVIAYAILRYRLMDITVIIRETAIFAGIYGFAVGVFVLVMLFGQTFLARFLGPYDWILPVSALFVITFSVRPIEKAMYNTVGRQLFKRRFEYQKALRDASVGMARIKEPNKLLNLIVHIITRKMQVDNAGVLLLDENNMYYTLKASRGKKAEKKGLKLDANEPLINWLFEKKDALVYEELDRWLKDERLYPHKSVLRLNLDKIKEQMELLGASVCIPSFYRDVLLGILILGDKISGDMYSQDDLDLLTTLSDEAAIATRNALLFSELHKKAEEILSLYEKEHRLFIHTSIAFAAAIDARDEYTHGHSERVTTYSLAIADNLHGIPEMDKDTKFREKLHIAALLHDIGKIGLKDAILHKKDKLTEEEIAEMKKHPATGAIILSPVKELKDIIDGARYHHERYDGQGYPDGLKGEQIPLIARIIGVADTFDAMTTDRPYRKGLDAAIAIKEIKEGAQTQFDAEVVAAFLKAHEKGMLFGAPRVENAKQELKAAS